ncbi:MAG TPA: beta-ketoacyl synthase N-terminal-like domain-containing protein, partial [Candidatus Deferrimicrobium sp.]|nr:beta-ketoacyl synthase N-terminal-like domain-containing protein [Candidatus Deferrimicrobium sp.]
KFNRSYKSYRSYIFYKTGDLARRLPDGNVEFLGRIDQQVKIRGFRIELGEIEAQLLKNDSIKEAVVLDGKGESGEKYLSAYIVSKEDLDLVSLKEYLLGYLPDYMIPARFIQIESIPFTARGKVDREALQSYETTLNGELEYMAPGNDLEQRIAESWKEILKLEKVSIHDNFFERGGNSLDIIQLTNRLNNVLGENLPVVALFQYPTISALARYLEGNKTKNGALPAIKTSKEIEKLSLPLNEGMDIAVVGMAGRFPGAGSINEFWNNLKEGVESISFFMEEELREAGVSPEYLHDPNYVKAWGIIEGKEKFDAAFFDYMPADARLMDPQIRIFHECVWEAFENAGYIPDNYDGAIGLYAGASHSIQWEAKALFSQHGQTAGGLELLQLIDRDFLTTRVSYKLNLRGPAISIQTACSTSLVAVHMACRALITRECDMAAAGGVSVHTGKAGYCFREGMIYSPDGHCRPFDAHAGGTVGGEGIGIVILKRLKEAEFDGDNIYAVVKGSAINNDGINKVGYTAPSIEGQREVIANAL